MARAELDPLSTCLTICLCKHWLSSSKDPHHWWGHDFPTARPSHGSGLAIIRKLLIVFSASLASDNISWDFPTTSVSICLLWTDLSFVSICLLYPANDPPSPLPLIQDPAWVDIQGNLHCLFHIVWAPFLFFCLFPLFTLYFRITRININTED